MTTTPQTQEVRTYTVKYDTAADWHDALGRHAETFATIAAAVEAAQEAVDNRFAEGAVTVEDDWTGTEIECYHRGDTIVWSNVGDDPYAWAAAIIASELTVADCGTAASAAEEVSSETGLTSEDRYDRYGGQYTAFLGIEGGTIATLAAVDGESWMASAGLELTVRADGSTLYVEPEWTVAYAAAAVAAHLAAARR